MFLLTPIVWFFAIVWCSGDSTGRRFVFGLGAFFLGLVLVGLTVEGPTWQSLREGAFALSSGVGLLAAAAVGRAYRLDGPDPIRSEHDHG